MQHTDYLSKTEDSIYFVIDQLRDYTKDGYIASLFVRKHGDLYIQKRLAEVRQCLSIVHVEYLNLVEYSLTFNELWATEDNNRFSTAERMFNMLKTSMESVKREFRRSCPISRRKLPDAENKLSVFKDAVLVRGGCSRDLFGLESFSDSIQALFYEQRALFTNVLASLLICRDVIQKEKATKANQDDCIMLLEKQCDEIIADLKNSIKYTQAPVTCEIQQLIEKIGLANAAQQGFHHYGLDELTEYALYRNAHSQLSQVVSLDIAKCYQNADDIRYLFNYFDEFRSEPTRKKPSSLKVLFAVNWMGNTCEWPEKRCYDILARHYKRELPQWHTVSTKKNAIKDLNKQQQQFNDDLKAFIAEKKGKRSTKKAI